jgi:hypothetical protein
MYKEEDCMKSTLKNLLMLVLITAVCIALFTNFTWADSNAVNHHNSSYDKISGKIDLIVNLTGGYYDGYKIGFSKGYNDGYKGYENDPENAYKYSKKPYRHSSGRDENLKGFLMGYEDGFREDDSTR